MMQRWMTKFLKVIFVISTACFLIIQIHIRRRVSMVHFSGPHQKFEYSMILADNLEDGSRPDEQIANVVPLDGTVIVGDDNGQSSHRGKLSQLQQQQPFHGPGGNITMLILGAINSSGGTGREKSSAAAAAAMNTPELKKISSLKIPNADEIRRSVEDNNANAVVLNDEKFADHEIAHVVVVQVHNRSKYLEKLIQSISQASNVSRMLLIFSHDYFSREIDQLIQSIKFCRVIQIFYPYSLQIYPNQFPGQDPRDCEPKIGKEKATEIKCQNYEHPDKYGNYRVAKFSQVKHHWWWKVNYVFDGISRLRNYTGWVLLLEEDHYVSPDFLYVFEQIIRRKAELCEDCSIISLGFYLKNYDNYASTTEKLCVYPWFSSRHNMGMAFNRETWNKIHACSHNFCHFDDYNWDWSLMHVNLKCLKPPPFKVIFAKAPRVFHIGDCGIHHAGKQCTADASATKFAQILNAARDRLFPERLVVDERSGKTLKAPKENGGWGDVRDHRLCMSHADVAAATATASQQQTQRVVAADEKLSSSSQQQQTLR